MLKTIIRDKRKRSSLRDIKAGKTTIFEFPLACGVYSIILYF